MRAVVSKKRKYTWLDLVRFLGLVIIHFAFIGAYCLAILGIHAAFNGGNFLEKTPFRDGWYLYPVVFGPLLNAVFHTIYSERGFPWFRLIMFIHIIAIIILVPITIFI